MEKLFHVSIITPEKIIYDSQASSLIVPAALGYLGVLANHAPIIANLVPGRISIRDSSGKLTAIDSKGKGFLEVLKNNATLLLDPIF